MIDLFTLVSWGMIVLAIYIASYYILLYFDAESEVKKTGIRPEVTVAVPSFNEEKNIYKTLESLWNSKYPKKKIHVRVVDDGSSDGTTKEVRRFMKDRPEFDVKLLVNSKNHGKAFSLNRVISKAKTSFIITMDADSEADPLAIRSLIEHSKGVSVVTPCVLPRNKKGMFQRIQAVEYIYGNYLANLLSGFDAQIVAPGPFSLFRLDALRDVGGFDVKSVAEDLEIVFRLRNKGHHIRMAPSAYVYTEIPQKLRDFIIQRRRWRAGFLDAVNKHPKSLTPFTEFGRQNVMNALYIIITLAFFVLILKSFYRIITPFVKVLVYVGFDPLTYLKNFQLSFDILGLDIQMIIYTIFMIVLTVLFIYLASKFHGIRPNVIDSVLFIFAYGSAVTTATLLAIYSWLKGDYSW